MDSQKGWEFIVTYYGLNSDDLLYILEKNYPLETVKDICEYWSYCIKEEQYFETFREADRSYHIDLCEAEWLNEKYKEVFNA